MLVGVDFDNTIVCCDGLFHRAAVEKGLIPAAVPVAKGRVRDYLLERDQEDAWTELQGYVYGVLIQDAPFFPGVLEFFAHCKQQETAVYIISHKTRRPFLGQPYDLHRAAQEWLESHGFFDESGIGLCRSQVFFELTKQEKLNRIAQAGCSHFIDDLPEFLMEPGFPAGVERILFDPNGDHSNGEAFHRATSWMEIQHWLIGVRTPD